MRIYKIFNQKMGANDASDCFVICTRKTQKSFVMLVKLRLDFRPSRLEQTPSFIDSFYIFQTPLLLVKRDKDFRFRGYYTQFGYTLVSVVALAWRIS